MSERALPRTGLVLSGGGVRGAYGVGVVAGIVEVLGLVNSDASPFHLYAGTSVGAINAGFLACQGHRGTLGIEDLVGLWEGLRLEEHLRVKPLGLWKSPKWMERLRKRRSKNLDHSMAIGRSLLDVTHLERLIRAKIDWSALSKNVASKKVLGLMVAALEISTGTTSVFAELAEGVTLKATRDPRRKVQFERIGADHVLASAALPLLFPARRIGRTFFCDGGLRFNTPIAPVIRAGAEKLVVVSALHRPTVDENVPLREYVDSAVDYPSLPFLLGKLLNAVLLDPIVYDLQILARLNRLWGVLEQTLSTENIARVAHLLEETRGSTYRTIDTLVFSPSSGIGVMAADYAKQVLKENRLDRPSRWFLSQALKSNLHRDADFVSYLLFDGGFCKKLIELGRTDARDRAEDIQRFFLEDTRTSPGLPRSA